MSAQMRYFHAERFLSTVSMLSIGTGGFLACAAMCPKDVTILYPLGFLLTKKLGDAASTYTGGRRSWGGARMPMASYSSNLSCSSFTSFLGYHGTVFSRSEDGRLSGMLIEASTRPKAALYAGRSDWKTSENSSLRALKWSVIFLGRALSGQ